MARSKKVVAFLFNYEGFNAEAQNLWENIQFVRDGGFIPFVIGPDSRVMQQSEAAGYRTCTITQLRYRKNPARYIVGLFKLVRLLRREKPDVLHIYYRSGMHSMGILAKRLSRIDMKIVRTRGTATPIRPNLGNRILYNRNTLLTIVPSERERQQLIDFGLPETKVETVHFPLDVEHYNPSRYYPAECRRKFGIKDELCLVHIGRFEPIKGHKWLIKAAEILNDHGLRFTLLLAGNTKYPHFREIKPFIRNNIRLLGWVEDVAELIAAADIGVISSIGSEANSRIALEYMAMKKPVVSTNVGILPDLIPDRGILVQHNDAQALADGILEMSVINRDKLGEQGYEYVHENFERNTIRKQFLQIYRKILQD